MMNPSSKTGLLASPTKKLTVKTRKKKPLTLKAITIPAPVVLRPYAEIQAIRDGLAHVDESKKALPPIECIPEELFRRYTETDSRPLTPAPTLASVKTRGSSSRRCVTPDAIINSEMRERTLLILDLRRSHSQEIISWQGGNNPPVINILQVPVVAAPSTPSISVDSYGETPDFTKTLQTPKSLRQNQKLQVPKIVNNPTTQATNNEQNKDKPETAEVAEEEEEEEEIEVVRRKGKRRKKRGRDSSRGPLAVQASIDPETQVSALNTHGNASSHPTLTKTGSIQDGNTASSMNNIQNYARRESITNKSIIDSKTLKHLQRELNYETIDLEFNDIKKAVLEEALRTIPFEQKPQSEEMISIKKELNLVPINVEAWLSLPRIYSRRNCRFGLPLISDILNTITPLQYLDKHTTVTKTRRLLYNMVFNRHKIIEDKLRIVDKDEIKTALGEMMGKPITQQQFDRFKNLVNWQNEDVINFKIWCGLCALFERIFAKEFCADLPDREMDPCDEVEVADFQSLERRLMNVETNDKIVEMLNLIKDL